MKLVKHIFLSISLVFFMMPNLVYANYFPDVHEGDTHYEAIMYLYKHNIINGYPDGYYRPYNPVSRIELLKIVMNAKGIDVSFDNNYSFQDIDTNMWYAKYVSTAYKKSYVNGNNGRFYPNNTVTKAESLKIIFNIIGLAKATNVEEHVYPDVNKNSWYAPYFKKAKDLNLITNSDDEPIGAHNPMNRGEIAEIIYRVLNNVDNNTEGKVFKGEGTYTLAIGDKLYDEQNNRYVQFTKGWTENNINKIRYNTLDEELNILKHNSIMNCDDTVIMGKYEHSSVPLDNELMNHLVDGSFRIKCKKIGDDKYRVKWDYAMQYVFEKAKGVKKILFVPIYLSDQVSEVSNHDLRMEYIVRPALDEIKAYIKTKQIQYLGKEIMWFDFTITNPIVPTRQDKDYFSSGNSDWNINRLNLIKEKTSYNPEDFDIIFYRFYTMNTSLSDYQLYASYHMANIVSTADSVTEWDLSNHVSIMLQKTMYDEGGLHEILHNFGMTDLGKNQGKKEYYVGDFYDGSQTLCQFGIDCPETNGNNGNFWGNFQYIDDFIAHEIGWTDRNNNNVLDVDEYKEYCVKNREDSGYHFCKKF